MNRIMVLKGGSPALHKLGDIGRDCDDFIRVGKETDEYYIGSIIHIIQKRDTIK